MNIVWKGSPNYRAQDGVRKKFIVMHWMAGTLAMTDRTFANPASNVSTQYGVEGQTVHQYVRQKDVAWGSGTTYANTYGVSIEHSGGNLVNGKRRHPSKATHETSARLCARISRRWELGRLKVGKNVFRHSYFVPTQCPGSLDVEWIVKRANTILGYD